MKALHECVGERVLTSSFWSSELVEVRVIELSPAGHVRVRYKSGAERWLSRNDVDSLRVQEVLPSERSPAIGEGLEAIGDEVLEAEIARVLRQIAEWKLPETPDGKCCADRWGSNGEREYMRNIAQKAVTLIGVRQALRRAERLI